MCVASITNILNKKNACHDQHDRLMEKNGHSEHYQDFK